MVIQKIAECAAELFCQGGKTRLCVEGLSRLRALLSTVNLDDVGISGTHRPRSRPPVAYASIISHPDFTMGIFFLGKGESIPLHDHPGMTVLSRVLYGRVRIKSRDWVINHQKDLRAKLAGDLLRTKPLPNFQPPVREVYMNEDTYLDGQLAQHTRVLDPVAGNVHAIYALTDCCFLDILSPPYAQGERDCHYYEEYTKTEVNSNSEVNN
eukprot:Ihof_evm2s820 gene=Ihof_evmTU2s820